MKDKKIAVLGGDSRNKKLYDILKKESYNVCLLGHEEPSKNILEDIKKCEVIIGPLPLLAKDNECVHAPHCKEKIRLIDVFRESGKGKLFFAGKITSDSMHMAKIYDIYLFDYLEREEFAIHNAVPTCEGTIKVIIDNTETTIYGSKVLILGYGRIGKILCSSLRALGAEVYCYARKKDALAWIESLGYKAISEKNLNDTINDADVIVNTIPAMILDMRRLMYVNSETLIIDLASLPGGVDFGKAEKMGIKTIHALGLPGIVAPKTAAYAIKKTVENIVEELEGWE